MFRRVAEILGQPTTERIRTVRRDDRCPDAAGRRPIPPGYVSVITMELRRKGIQVPRDESESPDRSQGQNQEDARS